MPTAKNGSGVSAQITSSTTSSSDSQTTVEPTGTAAMRRAGRSWRRACGRGAHGRAGGQPVVDQDHDAASDVRRRLTAAVEALAPGQLAPLDRVDRVDRGIADAEGIDDVLD